MEFGESMQAHIDTGARTGRFNAAERIALSLAAGAPRGRLLAVTPDGAERLFRGMEPGPRAELHIAHPRLYRRLLTGGDVAFAEAYLDGDWDSPDLTALIEWGAVNEAAFGASLRGGALARSLRRAAHLFRPNSRGGARRNIAEHYDLGNRFYGCWLDRSMTYSAALFDGPDGDLERAQLHKFRRLAALAGVEAGHHLLEVGCGWGGFALWAAREIGCRVTAVTISRAQHDFAAQRVRAAGLADRVEVRLQDYRDLEGRFDSVVSIEMLEAVGEPYWPRYFGLLRERLKPGGRAALQVITIDDAYFQAYRRDADFIQRHVFPGGMLPSPSALRREVEGAGLVWREDHWHGADYARTLALWHGAFEDAWPRIRDLGFDERFRRLWRYYLAYCEAGFNVGRIDLLQLGLSRD